MSDKRWAAEYTRRTMIELEINKVLSCDEKKMKELFPGSVKPLDPGRCAIQPTLFIHY